MSNSKRGGKRENSGRPKGEATKMMRVPVSLADDLKKLVEAHRQGKRLAFDLCIQESNVETGPVSALVSEFFTQFRHYENDIELGSEIATYLELFEKTIINLPRSERKFIMKLTEPKKMNNKKKR